MNYIKRFSELRMADIALVGGKNAALGEMIHGLSSRGIAIPDGFALTVEAYKHVLEANALLPTLKKIMARFTHVDDLALLQQVGHEARSVFYHATMPDDLVQEITTAYAKLCAQYGVSDCDVAVRSSATAEDLPTASFAGQQEAFLNIKGTQALLQACKMSMASLFTNRAIVYRMQHGFDHFAVALSVGVQKMVRADLACSGVIFTLDTESGFKEVVVINAAYGLGDPIVQGSLVPDEFVVHKPTLEKGFRPIVKKEVGSKKIKRIYAKNGNEAVIDVPVLAKDQRRFCLSDDEVLELARFGVIIENYYSDHHKRWTPMDIEWAKDGIDGKLYVLQARPETVYSRKSITTLVHYTYDTVSAHELAARELLTGQSIGQKIVSGAARILSGPEQIESVQEGDIIVTYMTDPDWVPVMKKAAGIITQSGGRTCHAAIVSRELGIPALVGAAQAMEVLRDGMLITLDCSRGKTGYVYEGQLTYQVTETNLAEVPATQVAIMVNVALPDRAYDISVLPVAGVGLARSEFIIADKIQFHPMAAIQPDLLPKKVRATLEQETYAYGSSLKTYFIERLAQGIGTIAAAFYPKPVIVRFSDFKSNEYRNLIGGTLFEPEEENPMIGFRGASRYYDTRYAPAFALECAALKKVRDDMGLVNVKAMVPFVRTVREAQLVLEQMERNGLVRGQNGLEVVMMCEIPSNVICIDEFAQYFDGFSIGSNDLTQTTLAVDRDSGLLANLFDERDEAVKRLMRLAIEGAHRNKRFIGICGQAPSDYPEIAEFLICAGIDSLSLNDDSILPFIFSCGPCRSKGLYCTPKNH